MTPQKWKTVRIFISSTFRDMHAERDYLVRFVFPELKEKCRKKRVNLIDVDLRWGVTEADAQDGKALDVCLDEIDSCRPYFLGLLGHRYGWVPPGEEHSITAQEIYHGVLHTDVPHQVVDLRQIIEGKLEGKALTNEQVNCLVRCYQWDPDKGKYLLKDDATDDGLQIIRSVFGQYSAYQRDRSFFFFRWEGLTKKLADTNVADFFEAEKANQDKLVSLKQEIIDAGLPWFEYDDIESFGNKVGETLWHRIEAELGELVEKEKDWLEEEAEFHELFMADRTRRFVGRRDVLDRMRAFCEGTGEPSLMVVTGEPGCGKSALMARFTEEVTHDHPGWLIIPHFVGASPTSTNLRQTLRRFCSDLNQITKSPEEVPEDIKELLQVFPSLLEKTSEQKRLLIAIDAANQFEKADNAHDMRWLPQELPSNVRFVISTLGGDAYNALLARRVKPAVEEITGLNEIEIRELVGDYLEEIRHEFPNPRVEKDFFEKVKDGNPLYMLVALEELRVFGEFDRLGERVGKLPDNVPALFDQVLERVESDFNHALVRDCMSFIACGRQGMTAEELQTLLKAHAPQIDPDAEPDRLPDMIWARLYRAFGPYLFERSGVIDFFHGQFKEAVGKRYLQDESERNETHKRIADYFEGRWQEPYHRAVQELPHQRTKAQDWDGVERVLTDLFFIEAKCAAGMTYDLIADYNTALNGLPEAQEIRRKEEEHKRRVRQYTEDLIAFARGEIENLDIIPSVEPWSEEKARKETERIINSPTCLDRIRAFSQFVNSESHRLVKYGNMPNFGLNQAYNSARSGPVVAQAESVINSGMDGILILRARRSCSKYSAYPANLKTLQGHTSWVASVSVTPDGRLAVSGSQDETVRVWDIETGKCIKTLEGHRRVVTSVSVTPDGKRALSAGGGDKKLRVWDIETGECIKSLEGHASWVKTVSVTPDGRLAVSGGNDRALRVWDIGTGECIKSLEGHTAPVNGVSVTSDGKRAVSVGRDETVRVWDIETGKCIKSLEGHTTWVNSVSVTPDGKRAVSVGRDKTLRVWDIETGQCIKSLDGHRLRINSVSVTSDGKRAVSVGRDKTLRVWDIETGQCTKTLEGHTDWVESVSVTPDGRLAVSGSQDKTVRVWDIETGQCIKILEDDLAGSLTVTPDGKMAVSASSDETVRVWDIETGQCIKILRGHTHVQSISVTPDGKRAVSAGSKDETLRVWDIETGECIGTLRGHKYVQSVSMTPDGKRAVSGGQSVRVWDIETGQCIKTLEGHTDWVESVSVTPDGRLAVSGSQDETVRVWDIETGQCIKTLEGHRYGVESVSVTPDGRRAVSAGGGDETVRVWDIETGQCIKTLEGHTSWVKTVSVTPDGRLAVSGGNDRGLRVWDIGTGECIKILEGHTAPVNGVSVTSDGKRAVSAGTDKKLRVWDIGTGECIKTLRGHTDVQTVSVTSDGKRAVSAGTDKKLRVWDIETEKCIKSLEWYTHWEDTVSVTPDGKRVVSGGQSVRVWDIETGQCINSLEGHRGVVTSVSVTPDGRLAVSGSQDKTVRVWDIETGQCIKILEGHRGVVTSASVTSDGRLAVSRSADRSVRVWDIETGECIKILRGHTDARSISVTSDGKRAVSAGWDETLRVWDIETGDCVKTLGGYTGKVESVSLTPDGRRVVSGGYDRTLRVWDIETGGCIKTLEGHTEWVKSVSVTPDGRRVVSGGYHGTLRVWDIETGKCINSLKGHRRGVTSVSVTPDGRLAVSGSQDKTVRVWDVETGKCIKSLKGDRGGVESVSVTPDGRRVVSGGYDGTLRVWDIETGECIKTLEGHTDSVNGVSVTPDVRLAVSGSADRSLRVWDIETEECIIMHHGADQILSISDIRTNGHFVCGTTSGVVLYGLSVVSGSLIPVRLWLYGENETPGHWDGNVTTVCQACGKRFPITNEILAVVTSINCDADLSPDQSEWFAVQEESWEDSRLVSECPLCHMPLKFNPFIVDNYNYQKELAEWKALPWWKRFKAKKPEPPKGI